MTDSRPASLTDAMYRPPRFDRPMDVEEHVRLLPPGAACKGLFVNDPIARLKKVDPRHPLLSSSDIAGKRYVPFFDYPYSDFMRLLVTTARAVYPSSPVGEGLRRLGSAGYEALLQSHAGKVMFGVFGRDFEKVAKMGARGWAMSVSFGRVELEDVGPRHVRYHFHDLPAFLETYQVGVVQGAMSACGVDGDLRVHLRDMGNGSFDVRWREPQRS